MEENGVRHFFSFFCFFNFCFVFVFPGQDNKLMIDDAQSVDKPTEVKIDEPNKNRADQSQVAHNRCCVNWTRKCRFKLRYLTDTVILILREFQTFLFI